MYYYIIIIIIIFLLSQTQLTFFNLNILHQRTYKLQSLYIYIYIIIYIYSHYIYIQNPHPACKIYEGICSCSANYIGETKRNVETRWNERENPNKDSEPAKHLRKFLDHKFDWKILLTAPTSAKLRKILESLGIALKQPSLNEQLDFDKLILFRNGVTQIILYFNHRI